MVRAYVLINTDPGVEEEFLEQIRAIEGVKKAESVYGMYDFIAEVEADTMEKLKEIITWKIRRLEHVRSSVTLVVV
jgi:DNA-binding Lrp family transcriptional regulator